MIKIIKSISLLFLVTITSFVASAQSDTFSYKGNIIILNNKVEEHFGSDYVQNLKVTNVDLLLYLNYFVENAFTIEDIHGKANESNIINISQVKKSEKSLAPNFSPSNPQEFNVLSYDMQLKDETQVIKTGIGNNAIIIRSKKAFLNEYNNYRNSFLK